MQKTIEELEKFNKHCLQSTISTLISYYSWKHGLTHIDIMNLGSAGIGKSFSNINLLRELELPFRLVTGNLTPKDFFNQLYEFSDEFFVYDDVNNLTMSFDFQSIFLSALGENRVVEWNKDQKRKRKCFEGTIIINTNYFNNRLEPLKDRIVINKCALTKEQIINKINIIHKGEKIDISGLNQLLDNNPVDLTKNEENELNEMIVETIKGSNEREFSCRIRSKIMNYAKAFKSLFGYDIEMISELTHNYISSNDNYDFVLEIVQRYGNQISSEKLNQEIRNKIQVGQRRSEQIIKNYVDSGRILKEGRILKV